MANEILGMARVPGTAAGTGLVSTPLLLSPCVSRSRHSHYSSDRTAFGSSRSSFLTSKEFRNW